MNPSSVKEAAYYSSILTAILLTVQCQHVISFKGNATALKEYYLRMNIEGRDSIESLCFDMKVSLISFLFGTRAKKTLSTSGMDLTLCLKTLPNRDYHEGDTVRKNSLQGSKRKIF